MMDTQTETDLYAYLHRRMRAAMHVLPAGNWLYARPPQDQGAARVGYRWKTGPFSPTQLRRAMAYVYAIHAGDEDAARAAIAERAQEHGHLAMAYLLVEFAGLLAHAVDDMREGGADPVADVLLRALEEWARGSDEEAAEGISRAVRGYLLVVYPGTPGDFERRLDRVREVIGRVELEAIAADRGRADQ